MNEVVIEGEQKSKRKRSLIGTCSIRIVHDIEKNEDTISYLILENFRKPITRILIIAYKIIGYLRLSE